MGKRLVSMLCVFAILVSFGFPTLAVVTATSEAPMNLTAREDNSDIQLRWTLPDAAVAHIEDELDGDLYFCIDWRVDGGPWHYDVPAVTGNTYDTDSTEDSSFFGLVANLFWDENLTQEIFTTHWSYGLNEEIDLANHRYEFRMRLALADPEADPADAFQTSPYSNVTAIGGKTGAAAPTALPVPQGLTVEPVTDENQYTRFQLRWTNPAAILTIDEGFPIEIKVDFRVGNGKWFSETHTQEWWSGDPMGSAALIDPVEREMVDKIVIDANVYSFRILYAYEPYETANSVYSEYSNIATAGIKASAWALGEVAEAAANDLIPDRLKGADLTKPITREEFAELAVKLYEAVTGSPIVAGTNPFTDTQNQEIVKAFTVGITAGTGDGTTFTPNQLINREQCATMLYRALKKLAPNKDYTVATPVVFQDQAHISSWATEATQYMAKVEIIKGSKGNFMPKAVTDAQKATTYGQATREAAILMSVRSFGTMK